MPQDPNASFDHAVMEMIEHSPTGAVPHTPSYADALKRLHASRQVYASADYKDGHVTARSLARRPHFHASNLEALAAGQIRDGALETSASIFDRYVLSLPAAGRVRAEAFRAKAAGKPIHHRKHYHDPAAAPAAHDPLYTMFLVPGTGPNRGLPGNYLYGSILEISAVPSAWALHLHDSDDGAVVFDAPTLRAAVDKLQEVFESAPFHLSELEALGFRLV